MLLAVCLLHILAMLTPASATRMRSRACFQAGLDQGATQGAGTAGGASPGVGGQAPAATSAAQGGANDPVLVIQSCPGCTFTVTRAMLEGSPRLDLERIYTALLQNIQSISAQYREVCAPSSPLPRSLIRVCALCLCGLHVGKHMVRLGRPPHGTHSSCKAHHAGRPQLQQHLRLLWHHVQKSTR